MDVNDSPTVKNVDFASFLAWFSFIHLLIQVFFAFYRDALVGSRRAYIILPTSWYLWLYRTLVWIYFLPWGRATAEQYSLQLPEIPLLPAPSAFQTGSLLQFSLWG